MSSTVMIPPESRNNTGRTVPQVDHQIGGFSFVNLTEPRQSKDKEFRKIVRSNAMRSYRQKEKKEKNAKAVGHKDCIDSQASTENASTLPGMQRSVEADANETSKPRSAQAHGPADYEQVMLKVHEMIQGFSTYPIVRPDVRDADESDAEGCTSIVSRNQHARGNFRFGYSPRLRHLLDDGMGDPFDVFPVEGSRHYRNYLLNHLTSVMARNYLPIDPGNGHNPFTKVLVPYAMTDPVLFLATLSFAATNLDVIHGQSRSPITLAHKVETIRLVNERLRSPAGALTNTSIGAVAMLAAQEGLTGNRRDLKVHMNALARMVQMRGGLQTLGWDGVLHMFISWQDMLCSAMTASPPQFARTTNYPVELPYPPPIAYGLDRTVTIYTELTILFHNMRFIAHSVTTWDPCIAMTDLLTFSKQRSTLEHRLISLTIRRPREKMQRLEYHLEACRLAALIFLRCVMHNFKPICMIMRDLKGQLMDVIREGESKFSDFDGVEFEPGTLTWVPVMGGLLALDRDDEGFFARRVANATTAQSWDDLETCLRGVCWVDCLQTVECESLWRRVVEIRKTGVSGAEC